MNVNLTKGNIKKQLMVVSAPIIVTSFVKMLNSFIDMYWINIGLGDNAIASIGIVSLLIWLVQTIANIGEVGTQVAYAQALGLEEEQRCKSIGKTGVRFNFYFSLFIVVAMVFFSKSFLDLYNLENEVKRLGYEYLVGVALGVPFMFYNFAITGILHAKGNTKATFVVNSIAVVTNIILDPIFIFVFSWDTFGAGLATSLAQVVGAIVFTVITKGEFLKLVPKADFKELKKIAEVGVPNFTYNCLFIFTTMVTARFVANFGTEAVAVQQIGTQLEALSWMTAGGFGVAVSTFVGQNIGPNNFKRAMKGVKVALIYALILGLINTIIFLFFGEEIISLFLQGEKSIDIGIEFMKINSISQIFMCIELVASGAFLGLSKATYSSTINAIFVLIRIPMVMYLSREDVLGLNGVWWTIVISCILKGVFVNFALFIYKKFRLEKEKS